MTGDDGTAHPSSPQAREMVDESMVRTLAAQAQAIWPQEAPLLQGLPSPRRHVTAPETGPREMS